MTESVEDVIPQAALSGPQTREAVPPPRCGRCGSVVPMCAREVSGIVCVACQRREAAKQAAGAS